MTLDEAILQQIKLGHKDPAKIVARIEKAYDSKWLAHELLALKDDIIGERARQLLGRGRRRQEIVPTRWEKAGASLMLESKWVSPEIGWKRLGDLTPEDCRAIARHYGVLALAAVRRRQWFDECAELMEARGVQKLSQLEDVPALPEAEVAA